MRRLPQCRNFYPQANNRTEWMNLARLQEAEGGESRDRGASQRHTEDHSGEHVAEEMHPQHDAGQRNAKRQEKQRSFQRGIEIAQDQRDGKCRHRMARWKGELIGRQYLRPAVRLDLAGPEAVAELLQRLENKNPRNRCGAGRADCRVPLRSAKEKKHDSESVPDPAVPHPSRGNHPDPKPARCAPAPWRHLNLPSWPRNSNPCPTTFAGAFRRSSAEQSISGRNEFRGSSDSE